MALEPPGVFSFVHVLQRVPYDHCLKQPNDRGSLITPRSRFPYSLHCKNAANSAPHSLICTSHNDPRIAENMSITTTKIVMMSNGFCSMRFTPYRRGANLSLAKVDMARASVKQKCFPGLSLFRPSGNPSDLKVEGTRAYSTCRYSLTQYLSRPPAI